MDYFEAMRIGGESKTPYNEIARKVFLTYPTHAFLGKEECQYEIYNSIASFFSVPITSVNVAGSAKIGRSLHKERDFIPGVSDLDVAIIDGRLFVFYMEYVCGVTRGYSDLSKFPLGKASSTCEEYLRCLSKGIFRLDLMVAGPERARVNNFFGQLSSRYSDLFSSINVAIYLSESFFENKQRSVIKNFLEKKETF